MLPAVRDRRVVVEGDGHLALVDTGRPDPRRLPQLCEVGRRGVADLGFGRIVVSEVEVPNMFADPVWSG